MNAPRKPVFTRWYLAAAIFVPTFLLIARLLGNEGALAAWFCVLASFVVNLVCASLSRRFGRCSLLVYWLQISYTIQSALVLIFCTFFSAYLQNNPVIGQFIFSNVLILGLGLACVPVACCMFSLVAARFTKRVPPWNEIIEGTGRTEILAYLWSSMVFHMLVWYAVSATDILAYLIRVIWAAVFLAPFLAGQYIRRARLTAAAWICCLLFILFLASITGSRGMAFVPTLFFLLGVARSGFPPTIVKRVIIPVYLMLASCGIMFAGLLEETRSRVGRGGLEMLQSFSFSELLNIISQFLFSRGTNDPGDPFFIQGLYRLISWTNVVVPIMSPEAVPYRGFDDLVLEVEMAARFTREGSGSYFENLFANHYGFYVSETSSVEWGLIADGWSRGGFVVAFAYVLLACGSLFAAERAALLMRRAAPIIFVAVFFALLNVAIIGMQRSGAVSQVRSVALNFGLAVALTWPVVFFFGKSNVSSEQR